MNPIKTAIVAVGGVSKAARLCGVSSRAINKWVAAGKLPRTDFTGETQHAVNLARGADGQFTADSLIQASAAAYRHTTDDSNSSGVSTASSAPEVPVQAYSCLSLSSA